MMIEKVKKVIIEYGLINPNDTVIVGLSGGPDSTALTVSLAETAPLLGAKLIIAHFNHCLRGRESDEDEIHARQLAQRLKLPFVSQKMDKTTCKRGISPEDFYRSRRYSFFDAVSKTNHADKIALGHNLQDQAETVLLHFLRGSGLDGLKGIMPMRDGKFIRPMITISREEIIAFLDEMHIPYRKDSSNKRKVHLRNKIRLELLPYLMKEFNPRIHEALAQLAEIIRVENEFIRDRVSLALQTTCIKRHKNKVLLNIEYLDSLPLAIQRRVLKELLESFSPEKNGFTFNHIISINHLLHQKSGSKISLPLGLEARREYDKLAIEKKKECKMMPDYQYEVKIPGEIRIPERKMTVRFKKVKKNQIDFNIPYKDYFDLDKIHQPLVLRNRREGDWFQPLGMSGRKTLKAFFIDHKITQQKRREMILLADRQSVVWIEKMHLSDRVKITPETKNVLELEII